jgi:hypothetical protein
MCLSGFEHNTLPIRVFIVVVMPTPTAHDVYFSCSFIFMLYFLAVVINWTAFEREAVRLFLSACALYMPHMPTLLCMVGHMWSRYAWRMRGHFWAIIFHISVVLGAGRVPNQAIYFASCVSVLPSCSFFFFFFSFWLNKWHETFVGT